MRRWRIGLAVPVVLAVAWVLMTRSGAVAASHPANLVILLVVAVVGLVSIVTGIRTRRPRPEVEPPSSRVRSGLVRGVQVLAVIAVVAVLMYLRPYAASDRALAAMQGDDDVLVIDRTTEIVLEPVSGSPAAGLAFYPGALVDPRAYVPLLNEVARAGYVVHIVKPPLGVALLGGGTVTDTIEQSPQVPVWVTGGHSLGGVAAASYAGDHPDTVGGLILWASYPQESLASSDLQVMSLSGTRDGLTTPDDIAASRDDLPPGTTFVAIDGAVHAFFGDYGPQRGDGEPAVPRARAQTEIAAASVELMAAIESG